MFTRHHHHLSLSRITSKSNILFCFRFLTFSSGLTRLSNWNANEHRNYIMRSRTLYQRKKAHYNFIGFQAVTWQVVDWASSAYAAEQFRIMRAVECLYRNFKVLVNHTLFTGHSVSLKSVLNFYIDSNGLLWSGVVLVGHQVLSFIISVKSLLKIFQHTFN